MRTGLTYQQSEILWSDIKKISWLFEITLEGNSSPDFYWSTCAREYNSQNYDYKIIDFDNLQLQMVEPYLDTIPETRTTIMCSMKDSNIDGFTSSDFKNATVIIRLIAESNLREYYHPDDQITLDGYSLESSNFNETEIIAWKFIVENTQNIDQQMTLQCLDFFSNYLEGDYPNNSTVTELFPNLIMKEDNICVPEIYGNSVYITLRWIMKHTYAVFVDINTFIVDNDQTNLFSPYQFLQANCGVDGYKPRNVLSSSYHAGNDETTVICEDSIANILTDNLTVVDISHYVLGESETYTISEARSAKDFGKSTYSTDNYTFKQDIIEGSDDNNYSVVQLLSIDSNNDGTNDANIAFGSKDEIKDAPFLYSKNTTVSITSPIDVIVEILKGYGISASDIDNNSVTAIKTILDNRNFSVNVGLFYTQDRKKLINKLCTLSGIIPIIRDRIYFKLLTKVSQLSIEEDLLKPDTMSISSQYTYTNKQKDSGYVNWQYSHEPQSTVNKSLVPCKTSTSNPSDDTIECEWVNNSSEINAKKSAKLALQRKLLRDKTVSFTSWASILTLEPGDIISINNQNQGAEPLTLDYTTDGLLAYWNFNNNTISGSSVSDISGNGYTATMHNNPTTGIVGKSKECIELDAINQHCRTVLDNPSDAFSLEFWFKTDFLTSADNFRCLMSKRTSGNEWRIGVRNSRTLQFLGWDAGNNLVKRIDDTIFPSLEFLDTNNWYFCTITYNGTTVKIYVNNELYGSSSVGNPIRNTNGYVYIGNDANFPNRYWSGQIDECRIYSKALNTDEIALNYSLSYSDYSSYDMLITKMTIEKNLYINIQGNTFTDSLNDWGDLTVFIQGAGSVENNEISSVYQGPDSVGENANTINQNIIIGTNGELKTNNRPNIDGGFIATKTHLRCYNDNGEIRFEVVYDGNSEDGDCTIGDYVNGKGLKWDQSENTLTIKVDSAGGLTVAGGGDIELTGSDTDPGKLRFYGTSYSVEIGGDEDGDRFIIQPSNDNVTDFYIGDDAWFGPGADVRFKLVTIKANDQVGLFAGKGAVFSKNRVHIVAYEGDVSDPYAQIYIYDDDESDDIAYNFKFNQFAPSEHKSKNLGDASYAWKDFYTDTITTYNTLTPVILAANAGAGAPVHNATKGTLYVTSAGVLYINTDGAGTWQKVGAQ